MPLIAFPSKEPQTGRFHRTSAKEAAVLMGLAVVVGMASAVSAIILNLSVHSAIHYLSQFQGSWWLIGVPAIGAGLSAFYIRHWLKDGLGHGVPELIRSVSLGGGYLRPDMIWSRLIASFLTVASGGSSGLEGPIATSGAAIGSNISNWLGFPERRRILLLGYGVAGAIAAIFNAPMTGVVFALEVILREWSAFSILPTILAAVTATQFSRVVIGDNIYFPHEIFEFGTLDLLACLVLGTLTGLTSVAFSRTLTRTEHFFRGFKLPPWATASIGGGLVGLAGYYMPPVLHDGYLPIQNFLSEAGRYAISWVALFIFIKFIAVCVTLGSGGSGGVFAPSLVLGSAIGYSFGGLMGLAAPHLPLAHQSAYALMGMAGMVAGVMHAPLTGMFLVMEVTGSYQMILPLMLTASLAMLVSYYFEAGSVYTRDLIKKGHIASRGSDRQVLNTLKARELIDQKGEVLEEGMLLGQFIEVFKTAKRNIFPVVEKETHRWLGVVYLDDIRPYLFETSLYNLMTMGEVMHSELPTIEADDPLTKAVDRFESSGLWSLPVVEKGRFLGMMSKSTLFDRYRRELIVHTET